MSAAHTYGRTGRPRSIRKGFSRQPSKPFNVVLLKTKEKYATKLAVGHNELHLARFNRERRLQNAV
jgi:hypothetical protein